MKKDLLVTFADKDYINPAKQFFLSVYWNAGWKGDYMLLTPDIEGEEAEWFKKKGIIVKKLKSPVKYLDLEGYPITTYSHFYLFTTEFKKWKNIISFDVDIIVRASFDELTKVNGFAACKDPYSRKLRYGYLFKNLKESIHSISKYAGISDQEYSDLFNKLKNNYDLNKYAFNAGVFAFSTEIIKKDTFEGLKRLFYEYGRIDAFAPQGIMNLFFYDKWEELPLVYNGYGHMWKKFNMVPFKKIDSIVLHFPENNKPWDINSMFYNEWKSNFDKADLINLKKILPPRKIWSEQEIKDYCLYIKKREDLFRFVSFFDRSLGLFGLFLKNNFPKLYNFLKSLIQR